MAKSGPREDVIVWWFVAATFVFVSPNLLFPEMPRLLHIGTIVVGLALVIVGFKKYAEERRQSRSETRTEAGQADF